MVFFSSVVLIFPHRHGFCVSHANVGTEASWQYKSRRNCLEGSVFGYKLCQPRGLGQCVPLANIRYLALGLRVPSWGLILGGLRAHLQVVLLGN